MPRDDEMTADERDAELEIARLRDTLGWSNDHLDPGERILARVLNRVENHDETDGESCPAMSDGDAVGGVATLRKTSRSRLPLVAVAAAAVAVIAVVVQGIGPTAPALATPPHLTYSLADPQDAESAPSARAVLTDVAQAARATPATGDGSVMFISSYGWYEWSGDDSAGIAPSALKSWMASDGSGLTQQHNGPFLLADGTLDPDPGWEWQETSGDTFAPGEGASSSYPENLPLDPNALRTTLLEVWGEALPSPSPDTRAAMLIGEVDALASTYVLDADTAAAVWDMLAQEESVVTLGQTRDRIGRAVVAIAAPPLDLGAGPVVTVLLIDPITGRMVGTETVTLRSKALGVAEPTVTGFSTITESRFVEAVGETS